MQAVGTDKTQKLCDEFLLHSRQLCNPQFVAEEHGLFGGHKSKDIRTFEHFHF